MADTPSPCGCTTVKSLVDRAGRILNDSTRDGNSVLWPTSALVDYMNEGLALLQSLRPDSFTRTVTLTLKPGSRQTIPDEYDSLVELLDNANEDGDPIENGGIAETSDKFRNTLQRYGCASTECATPEEIAAYKVSSFSKSGTDLKGFTVSPPVPQGAAPKVLARVVANPPCHDETGMDEACVGVPRKHEAALVDWMLHRSWLTDIESEWSFRSAAAAHDRFYLIVNAARLNEARFGSGYWMGQPGEGDENTNARNIP